MMFRRLGHPNHVMPTAPALNMIGMLAPPGQSSWYSATRRPVAGADRPRRPTERDGRGFTAALRCATGSSAATRRGTRWRYGSGRPGFWSWGDSAGNGEKVWFRNIFRYATKELSQDAVICWLGGMRQGSERGPARNAGSRSCGP